MKEKLARYSVTLMKPPGVSHPRMVEYIEEAVAAWMGQLHPDDPLFQLDASTVKVVRGRRKKRVPKPEDTKNWGPPVDPPPDTCETCGAPVPLDHVGVTCPGCDEEG